MKLKTLKELGIPDLTKQAYQALSLEEQITTYLMIKDDGKTLDSPVRWETLSLFFHGSIEELEKMNKTYRDILTHIQNNTLYFSGQPSSSINLLLPPGNQPYFTNNFRFHFPHENYFRNNSNMQKNPTYRSLWQRLDELIDGRDIKQETKGRSMFDPETTGLSDWDIERIVYYPVYITLKREGFQNIAA
ncbi:MAG: hypothetical protein A2912_01225 [Candidatus Buchananbacteria bacterium RIFCSPLOWO2_01_FULL_40_23b]|uniref:Uncharacterized protein n=1 Tax=Candidatus Buchananbacteria bacterium RIFCSPLOWO2_01_FULL_40_23b TaxID=1797544 RepID=A0A1G1YTP2_9BACT|nr:MAG: hypothetical protein A2912_01225 [Candidatus Buchananbacteria bacterium RIFCSPLOWO2_01_FULL_40_23b]